MKHFVVTALLTGACPGVITRVDHHSVDDRIAEQDEESVALLADKSVVEKQIADWVDQDEDSFGVLDDKYAVEKQMTDSTEQG